MREPERSAGEAGGAPRRTRDKQARRLAEGGGGHAVRGKARDEVFDWVARFLYRLGVRPNHLTLAQIPVYALMIYTGYTHRLVSFAALQLLVILLDGLDGTVARRMAIQSRKGAYLDAVFDLFGIVLVMVVAIWVHPEYTPGVLALLVANLLLYYQNFLLDEKAVSYVRGPVVLGLVAETHWPGVLSFAIVVPLVASVVILAVRTIKKPHEPPQKMEGPPPFHPGFKTPTGRPASGAPQRSGRGTVDDPGPRDER